MKNRQSLYQKRLDKSLDLETDAKPEDQTLLRSIVREGMYYLLVYENLQKLKMKLYS